SPRILRRQRYPKPSNASRWTGLQRYIAAVELSDPLDPTKPHAQPSTSFAPREITIEGMDTTSVAQPRTARADGDHSAGRSVADRSAARISLAYCFTVAGQLHPSVAADRFDAIADQSADRFEQHVSVRHDSQVRRRWRNQQLDPASSDRLERLRHDRSQNLL